MKKFYLLLCLVSFFTLSSCLYFTEEYPFLSSVSENISQKFDTGQIDITLNKSNNELIIVLKDPKFHNYTVEEKKAIAYQIGEIVSELKDPELELENGEVQFLQEKKRGVVKITDSEKFAMYR